MSDEREFEPKIVAYVCNWCTYLGADLAGTTRLEYPPNVRILRLPCTGRIDFNLIIKAFEIGADAVLVSGCHPGDCHYTAGNYHARRRWILFRELLDTLGFDMRRIHFTWISAAEGKKWQQVVSEITAQTKQLGPYTALYAGKPSQEKIPSPVHADLPFKTFASEGDMREHCRKLLAEGMVKVAIGYGEHGPTFVTRAEDAGRLLWNNRCVQNLTAYLKRKDVRALGKAAVVVKPCDEKSLMVLEKESQIDRQNLYVVGMACEGVGEPKCTFCTARTPLHSEQAFGTPAGPEPLTTPPANRLALLMALPSEERMAFWADQFDRCVRCYACRQVCPLCYCERCIVDQNRPTVIDPAASTKGNFAWHVARAFHQAGRCIGCGECSRACPAGIDMALLNICLHMSVRASFGYEPGTDPAAEPVIGSYSLQDKENFIR